jgi:hypothetical protein
MLSDIHSELRARHKRLAAIDRERSQLMREILGLLKTFSIGSGEDHGDGLPRISRNWSVILSYLATFDYFTHEDVVVTVNTLRLREPDPEKKIKPQTASNVRTQLSLLTKRGILTRVGGGRYQVAQAAKHRLKNLETTKTNLDQAGQGFGPRTAGDAR